MRGFCLLLMLALVVVALAICGPPAIAGQNDCQDYCSIATGPVTIEESPVTAPAPLLVVADPGSCDGLSATVAINRLNFVPITRRDAGFQRWRCRLLLRSAACG